MRPTASRAWPGENLRKALDWLPQGRRLVTVMTDCDLKDHVHGWPALDALALKPMQREELLQFYIRYGFKAWRKEIEDSLGIIATATATPPAAKTAEPVAEPAPALATLALPKHYETVLTTEALDAWIAKLDAAPLVAIDTETDSLDPIRARLVGISFSVAAGEAAYVPLGHSYAGAPEQLPAEFVLGKLKPWLEDASKPKLGQHIKYDTHVFANLGIAVRGYVHDTLLQSYVLEAHKPHALDNLAVTPPRPQRAEL